MLAELPKFGCYMVGSVSQPFKAFPLLLWINMEGEQEQGSCTSLNLDTALTHRKQATAR